MCVFGWVGWFENSFSCQTQLRLRLVALWFSWNFDNSLLEVPETLNTFLVPFVHGGLVDCGLVCVRDSQDFADNEQVWA